MTPWTCAGRVGTGRTSERPEDADVHMPVGGPDGARAVRTGPAGGGSCLAAGTGYGALTVWRTKDRVRVVDPVAGDDTGADRNVVDTVAFSPDGGTLVTDGWTKGALLRTQRHGHPGHVGRQPGQRRRRRPRLRRTGGGRWRRRHHHDSWADPAS
ncbi:hypothetical protein [Streptomyces mirabilis]|uniref:hypothetical protein n=1 Tax=Streptomyces mirabilis TaxID=68239 RepID=UPI0036BA8E65